MQRYLFIYICITIWFRIMFCMFVSSTFLLCGFNIVCKLHHYLIEYEHDTLSIIVRPTIHVLAQVSSEKLLIPVPSEPNVSCLHYIGRDLWPFVDLKLQNLTKKWIAHNRLTSSWNIAAAVAQDRPSCPWPNEAWVVPSWGQRRSLPHYCPSRQSPRSCWAAQALEMWLQQWNAMDKQEM